MLAQLNVQDYTNIVCVGDLHGDLQAFLSVLQNAKLVSGVTHALLAKAGTCTIRHHDLQGLRWLDDRNLLILMGDIIDGRRGAGSVCSNDAQMETHQRLIIYLIRQLQKGYAFCGTTKYPRIMVLLGNHDLANLAGIPSFCRYASTHACDATTNMFYQKHVEYYREQYDAMGAHNMVVRIYDGKNKGGILVCHGGFTDAATLSTYSKTFKLRNVQQGNKKFRVKRNLRKTNQLGKDIVKGKSSAEALFMTHYDILPACGRPTTMTDALRQRLMEYYNCDTLIKAHDGKSHVHCSRNGVVHTNGPVKFGMGFMCFTDKYMSKAFGQTDNGTGRYGYVSITTNGIVPVNF